MARVRVDQKEVWTDRETVAGDGGTFGGTEKKGKVMNLLTPGDRLALIPNEHHSGTGGSQGAVPGRSTAIESAVTFDTWVRGLDGTAAGDGVVPTFNQVSDLLASWAQQPVAQMAAPTPPGSPTLVTTGSTVEPLGGSTAIQVFVAAADADFFELPTANTIGVAGFTISGAVEWRPYLWDTATNSMHLLIALSAAPADSSVIYAMINFPRAEAWASAVPFPLATKIVGSATAQNRLFPGGIYDLSIPEVGPGDVPRISWSSKAFACTRGVAGTKAFPATGVGTVFAKGRLIIAKAGATSYTDFCSFRAGVEFGGAVEPDDCINDSNDYGISGWSRIQSVPSITVTVPRYSALPAGMTATDWLDAVENQSVAANIVHVFVQFGTAAGRVMTAYLPYCRAEEHEWIEQNGLGYEKVTFNAVDDEYVPSAALPAVTSQLLAHIAQG
jgi:hypothetical protein